MIAERREKKNSQEVSSQSLKDELVAIKDRISAIEIIQSVSNVEHVKKYAEEFVKTEHSKRIMNACREPRTKEELKNICEFNNKQALDHHLRPLREANLIRQEVREDGTYVFDWSYLFRSLPKRVISSMLGEANKVRERRRKAPDKPM